MSFQTSGFQDSAFQTDGGPGPTPYDGRPIVTHTFQRGGYPIGISLEFYDWASTATILGTFDDIFDSSVTPVWNPLPDWYEISANKIGNIISPPRAICLVVDGEPDETHFVVLKVYEKGGVK